MQCNTLTVILNYTLSVESKIRIDNMDKKVVSSDVDLEQYMQAVTILCLNYILKHAKMCTNV